MEKEFIPYEQALALKELGFDEPCFGWYRSTLIPSNFTEYFLEIEFGMNENPSDWVNSNFLEKACSAPLHQQVFRWFREKYGMEFNIECRRHTSVKYYEVSLFDGDRTDMVFGKSLTYEEAELECLKKLIEIVKNR